ncbi:MAG TPA: hypothetical protein VGZ27_05435 [Vicinamibacterales bacterium]|nr:hypothetical protein [Vicinamibacterales bacterium]
MNAQRVSMPRLVVSAAAMVMALAAPAAAQNESALKTFFEGKRVAIRIDLPGTSDGVDVRADLDGQMDSRQYGDRLKTYGTALWAGDLAVVTLVKVKKDAIEFQLSGGGYGTFGDDTSTSVYIPLVEQSGRERELERLVRDESDDRHRRELERELNDLRDRRERENRRIEAQRVTISAIKQQQIAERRLHGGSRFNIRYAEAVPRDIGPDGVMAALAEYVDFSSLGRPAGAPPPASLEAMPAPTAGDLTLHKGMTRADAERMLGPSQQSTDRQEGDVTVATLVFLHGDERITAEFIEDVLVKYMIASR